MTPERILIQQKARQSGVKFLFLLVFDSNLIVWSHLGGFEFDLVGEDGGDGLRGPGEVEVVEVVVEAGGGEHQLRGPACEK